MNNNEESTAIKKIAVIGSGISGLSSAWLLSQKHEVTLYEKDDRLGGHSHTVTARVQGKAVPVDTGFIVFNQNTYPNLVAFFRNLGVQSVETDMSFGVSLANGLEYSGSDLNGLFAQRSNLFKPAYWKMIQEILRFYRNSDSWLATISPEKTLGELLEENRFESRFISDHLLPMGAAIWSTPAEEMLQYPALAYLQFCKNHGLLQVADRPQWLTVKGGSRVYVDKIAGLLQDRIRLNSCVKQVKRSSEDVLIEDIHGNKDRYDYVVMATHADTTLSLLSEPDELEQQLLGAFQFQRNRVVLHGDRRLMPENQRAWSSWNYMGSLEGSGPSVTYWMNRLQHIDGPELFVSLNPSTEPDSDKVYGCYLYDHPVFDLNAMKAQEQLWNLQGRNRTWYCGAWFRFGFHEDGLQSGLLAAEQLGGLKRPWLVSGENDRLILPEAPRAQG